MNRRKAIAASALMLAMALSMPRAWSHGDGQHQGHSSRSPASVLGNPVRPVDAQLVDQHGRKLRFKSDALGDKVVVVSFVFTNCTDACPMVSHTFAQLQDSLAPLMEKRVRLVSLTVDPVRDTPARLKEYSAHFAPREGWLWLTGDVSNVAQALQSLGVHIRKPETHPAQILVGDPRTGRWMRLLDIDQPKQVLAKVDELIAAQRADKAAAAHQAEREQCTGPSPQAAAPAARPGCVAQPG